MLTVDLHFLHLQRGTRILDLGCGEGRHMHGVYMAQECDVFGVDISLEDMQTTRDGFDMIAELTPDDQRSFHFSGADATRLPFQDNTFDVIICSEVLEHIDTYENAIREMDRCLKPGGQLVVSVPRYWPEWLCWKLSDAYHNTPGGHVRIFKASQLRTAIQHEGFQYMRQHWAHALHVPYWWLKCLLWERNDASILINAYHRFLVWNLMKKPLVTHVLEKILNPLMGKSVVLYFTKESTA